MAELRPAWSWGLSDARITASPLLDAVTSDVAFGGATGRGVRVGIILKSVLRALARNTVHAGAAEAGHPSAPPDPSA